MRFGKGFAATVAVAMMAFSGAAQASTPIAGVKEEPVVGNLNIALEAAWTPDGRMLIAEKEGVLKVRKTNGNVVTALDLSSRVNSYGDRGLTGVAVDAAYPSNHYVYLLYTYDAKLNDDSAKPKRSRLTRIVLKDDSTVANAKTAPETVILGALPAALGAEACPAPSNTNDCIPADGVSHVNGTVLAAPDGTLYVGSGDGMFAATNSPDQFRPLDQTSLAGKILHIDRNGKGLPGHSFCPADNTLTHVCTKIYAQGFRNPFRFDFATRGGLWVGDVGASRWEELDHVQAGASYGWPCWEADNHWVSYQSDPRCQAVYAAGKQAGPVYSYAHDSSGACIIGGPEIHSDKFPASWQGSVFVGDIVHTWLHRIQFDNLDNLVTDQSVAEDAGAASLRMGPDGYLYRVAMGVITRFSSSSGNRAPAATATVTPYAGLAPLTTQFDASGSSDPDGDALTYKWDFGDGTTGTGAKPSHTYGFNGHYTATVTVSDPGGATAKASVTVVVGDRAPTVSFVKPDSAFRYSDGVPVDLQVNVSDPEDGTLSGESISWQVILQHNQHQHYIATATGASTSFTPLVTHGADSFYLVTVTATDSAGVATTKTLRVDPKLVNIRLSTNPASGVELGFDGGLFADPFSAQTVPGFQTTIVAPDTITDSSGRKLVFASWTDGGAATHDITIPNGDVQLVANYRSDTTPPDTVLDSGPAATTRNHQPRFFFHSTEPPYWFQCRMDSESWVGCASGWSPPKPLTNGTHKFAVRAWDSADNFDPTPATQQFTVIP